MKKVIVTRDNYEEVMFNLLENAYTKEIADNIHEQINADTFLSFEWQQWSKATYSESLEYYKNTEAEFIENLTKEEENNKKGIAFYWLAIAASLVLIVGLYLVLQPLENNRPSLLSGKNNNKNLEVQFNRNSDTQQQTETNLNLVKIVIKSRDTIKIDKQLSAIHSLDTVEFTTRLTSLEQPVEKVSELEKFNDTIKQMVLIAQKRSKYKITIVESTADAIIPIQESVSEKRYSMADVLNRKDGITLSKFFQNSTSRLVNDKATNRVFIEYEAYDHSILVLNLSN